MIRVRGLLLVATVTCSGCAVDVGPLPPVLPANVSGFLEAVRPLVGPAPLECNSDLRGSVVLRAWTASPSALAQWFTCAQAASTARRPFMVVLEQPPFEGWSVSGILGGGDGVIRAFHYYEGCCSPRTPSLSAGVCESPKARSDHGGLYAVLCANENASGFVPVPELWLRSSPLWPDLENRLRALTGGSALDCGLEVNDGPRGGSTAYVDAAFGCAEAAKASRRPFHFLLPQHGDDSVVITGLVGTSAGAVSRFRYERGSCGGAGCASTFEVSTCARPELIREKLSADVVCQAGG